MFFSTFPFFLLALVASYMLKMPPYIISLANFALAIVAADASFNSEDGGDTATVAIGVVCVFILNVALDKFAKRYPGGIFGSSLAATPTLSFSSLTTVAIPSYSGDGAAIPMCVTIRQLKEALRCANLRIKTLSQNELDALAEAKLFERLNEKTQEQNSALIKEREQLLDDRVFLRKQLELAYKDVWEYWNDLSETCHTMQCLKVDHANRIRDLKEEYAQEHVMDSLVQHIASQRDSAREELRHAKEENDSLYTAIASITQDLEAAQNQLTVMSASYKRLDDVCIWYKKKSEGLLAQVQMLLKGIFVPFITKALSTPSSTTTIQPAPVVLTSSHDGDAQLPTTAYYEPSGATSGLTSTTTLPTDPTMATENENAHQLSTPAYEPSSAPSGPLFPLLSSTPAANGNAHELLTAYGPSGAPSGPIYPLLSSTPAATDIAQLPLAYGPSSASSGPLFPLVSSTPAVNGNAHELPIAYGPSGAPSGHIFHPPTQMMAASDNGLPALSMGT
ncbi:hypothetical protein VSDG_09097 [Cytospora chrysosperma]|uniref:Uncharacterized protein n=1 Tax=Cytospora chrysosperma TaxID=252740 RepID=A0A423VE76_CYTCH|nr:hypothetical protein VSDG_09097 [Valsa sordida]